MFSGTTKYLMDANAIRSLSVGIIQAKHNSNRIIATIDEVKHEVAGLTRKLSVIQLEKLSVEAYEKMREILTLKGVRKVVDYYRNKGTADVALLAHALTIQGVGMLKDKVVIVTNDGDLRTACIKLDIEWISIEMFSVIE